jgi:hypothetical protein
VADGKGLAAVRERIRKSFLELHNDQRTREQRQADEEMIASIQTDPVPQKVEAEGQVEENKIFHNGATEQRAKAYIGAALRSPNVATNAAHQRNNVHRGWTIETPCESADELFQQALGQLEHRYE